MSDENCRALPIRVKPNPHNERYLKAKRKKMGHLL
jgi:GTP cyclohydrolase II